MARSKILQLFLRDPWGYVKPTKYGFPAISIGLHRLPHLKTSLLQGKNQFLLLVQVGQWGWPKYCIWGPTMGRGPHWTQFGPILVFCLCRSFPVRTGIFVKVLQSSTNFFKIQVLQNPTKFYKILQNSTKSYKILQNSTKFFKRNPKSYQEQKSCSVINLPLYSAV